MLERLALRDTGPAPSMELELAPRLNLFTGDNGLGKTFVLDVAWFACTDTWTGYQAVPQRGASVSPEISWRWRGTDDFRAGFDFKEQFWRRGIKSIDIQRRSSTVIFYARVDGGFSIWDPLRPAGVRHFPLGQKSEWAAPGFHFTPDQIWDGLVADDHDRTVLCNGLVRDWVTWQLQKSHAFEVLKRVLEVLSPNPGETIRPGAATTRISVHDVRDIPTIDLPHGTIPVLLASAGMKRIIAFAYLLVWMWREHVEVAKLKNTAPTTSLVILIDELDAHLHPQWQRVILPALLRVAQELDPSLQVQLFVTTHAPLVLASAEPHFDESRDALFQFDVEEGRVVVAKLPWTPRGDASAWLTSDVFELAQARSVEAERAILKAMEAMRDPNITIEDMKRIHHELHAVLKDTDPFWPRWLVRAKLAGIEP